jgi:ribonuclease T1
VLILSVHPWAYAFARSDPPASSTIRAAGDAASTTMFVALAELPPEARDTLERVRRGGPFRHEKDGTVFGNRERALPARPRGYYTAVHRAHPGRPRPGGSSHRRRGDPRRDGEYWYTDDHYRTFRRIRE